METDKKLNKDAKPGEMTMRGTVVPEVTGNLPLGHAFERLGVSGVCAYRPDARTRCMRQASEH